VAQRGVFGGRKIGKGLIDWEGPGGKSSYALNCLSIRKGEMHSTEGRNTSDRGGDGKTASGGGGLLKKRKKSDLYEGKRGSIPIKSWVL